MHLTGDEVVSGWRLVGRQLSLILPAEVYSMEPGTKELVTVACDERQKSRQ